MRAGNLKLSRVQNAIAEGAGETVFRGKKIETRPRGRRSGSGGGAAAAKLSAWPMAPDTVAA